MRPPVRGVLAVALTALAAGGSSCGGAGDNGAGTEGSASLAQRQVYDVHLLIPRVVRLGEGAEVRIEGARAGSVVAVRRTADGTDVDVALDDRFAPLHTGARAVVRGTFVKVVLGAPTGTPYLPDGGTVPAR